MGLAKIQRITLVQLYYENGRNLQAAINAYGADIGDYNIITVIISAIVLSAVDFLDSGRRALWI